MKFLIQFKIGNRWGAASKYSLREFCIFIVDKWSLTDREVNRVVQLKTQGEAFQNEDLSIRRVA